MIKLEHTQYHVRYMGLLPLAGYMFVCLGKRRVGMNCSEYLVQAKSMFHGKHIFCEDLSVVFSDNRYPENSIFSRYGKDLYKSVVGTVSNCTIEITQLVPGYLVVDAFFIRLQFV